MKNRMLVPVLLYLGMVTSIVSSLGAPLIPTIAREERVSLAAAQWSLTIALLMGAVATPTLGRLGDGRHRRRTILATLLVVALGCVLAAVPAPYALLVIGRGLMGTGLGLIPLTIAIARDELDREKGARVVSLLSVTAVAGIGLGYPVTGLIAEHASFHAAFWFGAVVVAAGLLFAAFGVPDVTGRAAVRLDWVGALLLAAGAVGLLLSLAQSGSWSLGLVVGIALASVAVLAVWVAFELRAQHPLVDLRLVRNRTVLTAGATGLLAGIGMYALMSMIIRFAQTPRSAGYGFGSTIAASGLMLLPLSVLSTVASRVAPALGRRVGQRAVLPTGCAIFIGSDLLFALYRGHIWQICLVMGLAGVGMGCTFAALPGLIVASVPPHETGSAMSFNQVLRYLGYSIGSALSATVLASHTPLHQALPTAGGYTTVAFLGVGVLLVAGLMSAILPGREHGFLVDSMVTSTPVSVD